MYHWLRALHRWIGLFGALFLIIIAATGFLLATKGSVDWIRPPVADAQKVENYSEVVGMERIGMAVFALGNPDMQSWSDVDRVDYRPKANIFKVLSKEGYHEFQVDGKTGEVIQIARRTDQIAEDIHDLSFFSDDLKTFLLPVISIILLLLGLSGLFIFFVPVYRRFKHRKKLKQQAANR
jgi:uncharacterized iron-regulated membrane protein